MCAPSQRWAAWWLICTGGGATAADASCFGAFRFLAAPGRITHHAGCLRLLSLRFRAEPQGCLKVMCWAGRAANSCCRCLGARPWETRRHGYLPPITDCKSATTWQAEPVGRMLALRVSVMARNPRPLSTPPPITSPSVFKEPVGPGRSLVPAGCVCCRWEVI